MAKKKKKQQSEAITLQKLANQSAKDVQKMINSANKQTLEYNKAEAEKAREFNSTEANTAREFNASEAEKAREFNASEAQKARDWQTEMSNTSHQREVADLRKAGLNPVLSVNSGAQSYTTSSASAQSASSSPASGSAASASLESGASAMSNLIGNLMSSLTGLRQTQMSTSAQLRAAELNSAATRYAADQNRAASQYSADMNYRTQMDKPTTNLVALADKYLGQDSYKIAKNLFDKIFKNNDVETNKNGNIISIKPGVAEKFDKIGKIFGITKVMSTNWNYNLNHQDKNDSYQNLIWRFVVLHDPESIYRLATIKKAYYKDNHKYKGVQK